MTVRFAAFGAVGAVGFVLQLAALWLLTDRGVHYLAATVVATEFAILLNFFGHERWTWCDRPAGARETMWRFCRFHGTNGAVSLAGGALIMPLLIEIGEMHYILANVVTVGVCALANFLAADRIVFRTAPAFLLLLALVASTAPVEAAELRPETLDAFNRYVRVTESRMDGELQGKAAFLWVDQLPEAERLETYSRLKRGETVVRRLVTRDAGKTIEAPRGLIHHWTGTAFIPGATVERTVALMQDYEDYQEFYSPNVRRSRTISRQGETFKVYLQLFVKKVIGVVLNTEYDVRYTRVSPSRVNVRSYTTKIAEVQDPGTTGERELPVGQDSGFLWRFYNYCSLDERAEGTYVQCESVSLSRAIPAGLGWIVGPFVTSIPRESLEFTLGRMRKALSYSGKQP
jgi:putative flippase GtrA